MSFDLSGSKFSIILTKPCNQAKLIHNDKGASKIYQDTGPGSEYTGQGLFYHQHPQGRDFFGYPSQQGKDFFG